MGSKNNIDKKIVCPICQNTGAVSVNMYGKVKPGIDLRYSNIDACPRCTYIAEIEYNG